MVSIAQLSVCNINATPLFIHICGASCEFSHNAITKLDLGSCVK